MRFRGLIGHDPAEVEGARISGDLVRRVWRFARPYRTMIFAFVGTIVASSLLQLVPPLLFREIIDRAIPRGDKALLDLLAVGVVVAAFLSAAAALLQRWLSAKVGEGLIFDLRVALFDHVQHMPLAFFTRTRTGALVSRLNSDVIGAQRALTQTLGSVVSNVVTLATTLTAMAALAWQLTLASLALLPVFLVPAKRVGRRLQRLTKDRMDLDAAMSSTMTERFSVAGALLAKLFGRPDEETAQFAEKAAAVRDSGVRVALLGRVFFVTLGLVGALAVAAIYWWGGRMVLAGSLTLGTLVALAAFVTRIYEPLTSLTNARVDLMTAFVSFERVFEVLDTPHAISDKVDAVDLVEPRGEIEFDDVWFTHPRPEQVSIRSLEDVTHAFGDVSDRPVIRGVSAHVAPGQKVALVGPSGAGKTTLALLVPRIYDVTSGAVRFDGVDVRDLRQASLRAAIGMVTQDPHLFHDTVANNLRYARPDATDEELVEACVLARIHHVIAALPDGYETVVGERGYRLSGGEKQRLAISRVLLKNPAVVILDEATSHLDAENEAAVREALEVALEGRTALVIAHRLSTVAGADQILFMEDGRIVETGSHEDLVAAGGRYAQTYKVLIGADR
ncbi:MAG: ABC transporter ATP-binding protein [Acidimicrobiales bacterium]|nr:MAG: ABC transporter ATP-binding protein [Acidimicrobiales bacterium]